MLDKDKEMAFAWQQSFEKEYCCGWCKQYAEARFAKHYGEKVWDALQEQNSVFKRFQKVEWGTTLGWGHKDRPRLPYSEDVPSGASNTTVEITTKRKGA